MLEIDPDAQSIDKYLSDVTRALVVGDVFLIEAMLGLQVAYGKDELENALDKEIRRINALDVVPCLVEYSESGDKNIRPLSELYARFLETM